MSESAIFYPAVTIRFGEPEQWIVIVAVDLDTKKAVLVQEHTARKGPQAVTLEDKEWVLESYGEQGNLQSVLGGTEITATFDSGEGRVHGSAECNTYFGSYEVNNKLSIHAIAWTEMHCVASEGIMEQEQQYLEALQSTKSYQIQQGELQLKCGDQILIYSAK